MLYAFDSYPNIILCFTAGFLINEKLLGIHRSIIVFTGFVIVGQAIMTLSALVGNFNLAILARIIMGIGIECQNVTFYAFIPLWFTEKEHGLASAASAMFLLMGMVSSEFSTPMILQST